MSPLDAAGLAGDALILAAYAAAQLRLLDPLRPASLLMNLAGSGLIVLSLTRAFNLAAFVVEAAWAGVAAFGLVRWSLRGKLDQRASSGRK